MTEIKIENGKNNVCRDDNNPSFSGLTRESVGDKKIPAFAGMTGNSRNERGRSMVEMLGVLAVAGVLSIGGVVKRSSLAQG